MLEIIDYLLDINNNTILYAIPYYLQQIVPNISPLIPGMQVYVPVLSGMLVWCTPHAATYTVHGRILRFATYAVMRARYSSIR